MSMNGCPMCPEMDWRPVRGEPCLHPMSAISNIHKQTLPIHEMTVKVIRTRVQYLLSLNSTGRGCCYNRCSIVWERKKVIVMVHRTSCDRHVPASRCSPVAVLLPGDEKQNTRRRFERREKMFVGALHNPEVISSQRVGVPGPIVRALVKMAEHTDVFSVCYDTVCGPVASSIRSPAFICTLILEPVGPVTARWLVTSANKGHRVGGLHLFVIPWGLSNTSTKTSSAYCKACWVTGGNGGQVPGQEPNRCRRCIAGTKLLPLQGVVSSNN